MLRITVKSDPGSTHVGVEGSLTQASADELKRCWLDILRSICRQHVIIVDLTDLANIDRLGKKLLLEMYRHGVKLIGSGVMTKAVIEEIANTPPPKAQ
jgi:ABC-type transporter Mla MlaB component